MRFLLFVVCLAWALLVGYCKLSDLQVVVLEKRDACPRTASSGDSIAVHYRGRILNDDGTDGNEFDSSYKRNQPFSFTLGKNSVIQGWERGLLGSCEGQKLRLKIPSVLGYGSRGAGGAIPPNADLVFDVSVESIKKAKDEL